MQRILNWRRVYGQFQVYMTELVCSSDQTLKARNAWKVSQFADDTNLFCANLSSVEKGLQIVADFGAISGGNLNIIKEN